MHELKSSTRQIQGTGCGIFYILFGLCFLIPGVLQAIQFLSYGLRHGEYSFLFGILVAVAFGVMMVWGGISQIKQSLRFHEPKVEISPEVVHPGEKLTFVYQRTARRSTELQSIGVFLVYREKVSYNDGSDNRSVAFDRLIQQSIHPGRRYEPGEFLREEHTLQIPAGEMDVRNPYMGRKNAKVETNWVVKVRLNLGKGYDIWDDYQLDVAEQPLSPVLSGEIENQGARFDVLLLEVGPMAANRIMNVMRDLFPHLHSGQTGDLYFARPSLLRENLSSAEAQSIKEKLEAAGAVIHIEPTDTSM